MKSRGDLNTEQQNPNSDQIDVMSNSDILRTINYEDQTVAKAVELAIPSIEQVVELTIKSIKNGGRVFYIGAGTSGRLGVLDASEIPPTFSAPKGLFIGIIAGGDDALRNSIEGAEDKSEKAVNDLEPFNLNGRDTLIGVSCSGAASYVISALDFAKSRGVKTVYLITNPEPFKIADADVVIHVDTGPEVVTGSTRMKAGSATKMVLNMISTTTMISLGKVYGNLMVDLLAVNEKLIDRGARIIKKLTGLNYEKSKSKLFEAKKSVKIAVVMEKLNCSLDEAKYILEKENGFLRRIIQ